MRAVSKFPAITYGGETTPVAIELDHGKLWDMQDKAEFYDKIVTLIIDGKEEKVKVQAVQRHALEPKLTRIDFIHT